jgi:hypothetical protein
MFGNKNGSKVVPVVAVMAIALAAVITVIRLPERHSDKEDADAAQLAEQNAALRKELANTRAALAAKEALAAVPSAGRPETPSVSNPEATQTEVASVHAAPMDDRVLTPTGMAKPPRNNGLRLAGAHAVPAEGGIKATMAFTPTTTDPMGIVAVVVRLPRNTASRIIQFGPSAPAMFSDLVGRVSDDGKFAVFQGTAQKLESLELSLSVSEPALADVRGTCGIGPFKLDVKSTGATVQQ